MKRLKDFSKRTTALLIAALLLVAGGTVTGARAAFMAQSDLFRAQFYVNHLQVFLLENGEYACDRDGDNKPDNTLNGEKVTGKLATKLGYKLAEDAESGDYKEVLGTVDPGRAYEEVIQARNGKDVEQYVRLTVRKYWLKKDGKKATDLSPALIKLTYAGKDYNNEDWVLDELTTESATYYYKTKLGPNATTEPLFDTLTIDKSVIPDMHQPTDKELLGMEYTDWPYTENQDTGSRTYSKSFDYVTISVTVNKDNSVIYASDYRYDGYTFYVEADVQALQTHNAQDAIHSQWGVYNVEVQSDGSLKVQ